MMDVRVNEIEPCEHEFVPLSFPKSSLGPIVSYQCARCGMRASKVTHTPSITVGTQVRLTGVVTNVDVQGYVDLILDGDGQRETSLTPWVAKCLEVIRQPFKRGEVVYFEDHNIACVVLEDEQNGRMLLIEAGEGKYATYVDADQYERRP